MIARRAFALALFALAAPAFAQPSEGGGHEQRRISSADSYLPIPTLSTAVLGRISATGTLVVDVGLDVPDATLRGRARSLQPRLLDALRTALASYASTYYRDRSAPDPDTLGRLMQSAVDRTLGQQGARLLMSNIIYQRRVG